MDVAGVTDYVLSGHKCRPVARMFMDEGRDWWLGELTEPLPDWPRETHCLHIKTPLKEVVLGVCAADMEQLTVLCYVVRQTDSASNAHVNEQWIERMAEVLKRRA